MQMEAGQKLLIQNHLPLDDLQSFIFIEDGIVYKQSTGAIKVCKHLRGLWPMCIVFKIIPTFLRDAIYNWIARNRYKWFGKKEVCMIPTDEVKARFLK